MRFARTDAAKNILRKRYYAEGETTRAQLLSRVASAIGDTEEEIEEFYHIMAQAKFLPNSPCLVNAGRGEGGLFACFVLGMEDDLESIAAAKSDAMQITKAGGGWGIPLGALRPKGARVRGSTHGVAGGPVGFLETFSADMKTMTQGGFRDAACMATLPVMHPDIREFIHAKDPVNSLKSLLSLEHLYGADKAESIAAALLDKYGGAEVMANVSETHLRNFNLSVLADDRFMKAVVDGDNAASQLFNEIATGAWTNGEPGLLFIDTIRKRTRYDKDQINATNPCGEQALPPDGSCCLGSINLSEFVTEDLVINMDELGSAVYTGVKFLDRMIDKNKFPTEATREWALDNRAIGLGVMGWADALVKLGIPYDSEKAIRLAVGIGEFIRGKAEEASQALLEGTGMTGWEGRKNRALLSIAPTGTISLLAGCSPGIELPFERTVHRSDSTGDYVLEDPLSSMEHYKTVKDLDPDWTVVHVAAWARNIDNSISYTVNLKNDASVRDVERLMILAWEQGCNGITVYRDGSRTKQVLSALPKQEAAPIKKKRPHSLAGETLKYEANISGEKTNVYVTVNYVDGKPWEVFTHTPQVQSMPELQLITAATRLSSLLLRSGVSPGEIVKQLRRVEGQSLFSIPAIISNALTETSKDISAPCPDCGTNMTFSGGCSNCPECGFSTCQ